jgi:hypothetical protein
MALNGRINLATSLTNTKDNVDLSTPTETVAPNTSKAISTGSVYHDTINLTASEVYSLDVGDGSLEDVYGQIVSLSGVTGLYIQAGSSNGGDLVVSGGVNSMLSTQPPLGASEALGFLVDIDVTSNSKLYFVNGATSGSVDLVVTGD